MPNSAVLASLLPPILIGAGMLMIMDASFNVAMEPFRALVADNLPDAQRSRFFGANVFNWHRGSTGFVVAYIMAEFLGVSETAAPGQIPDNVIYSFYTGAAFLMGAIVWTVITTKEYSPQEYAKYHPDEEGAEEQKGLSAIYYRFF